MRTPILCLALSLTAVCSHAQRLSDVPKRIPHKAVDPCRFNTTPPSYEADSKECRFLIELDALVERLALAADFKPGEIPLSREVDSEEVYDVAYNQPMIADRTLKKEVLISDGFVRCHIDDPMTAADVIAHEIGHAVQLREGVRRDIQHAQTEVRDRLAFEPRFEAQADLLGGEILRRIGIAPRIAETMDFALACIGRAADYRTSDTHTAFPTRWVEGVLLTQRLNEEKKKLDDARQRSSRMRSVLAAGAPWASSTLSEDTSSRPSWKEVLRSNDWKRISDDGRRDGAVRGVIKTDVPQPFTADRAGRIRLPGGKLWIPPAGILRYLSPAEIIAYATRGPIPPVTIQEGFTRGVEYLIRTQDWSKLPGIVTDK